MNYSRMLARTFVCGLLLSLAACASFQPSGHTPGGGDDAGSAERWTSFMALRGQADQPSLAEGSLRFGEPGDTHRVTWLLWGNDAERLRFDIQAGMGNTLGKARLADGELLLYLPGDNRALRGDDTPDGILKRIGLDLPLSLHELYSVIQGDFSAALDHPRVTSSRRLDNGGMEFELATDSPRMPTLKLELDERNLPVRWQIPRVWDIRISCGDDALPNRIDGTKRSRVSEEEYRFILLIKTRQAREAFPATELELQLPANVRLVSGL